MKELIAQYELLQQQSHDVYRMITELLNPFRIDDMNYANGDIKLRIWWGHGDWQIITDHGYISGYHQNGDVEIWDMIWHVLHGLPVVYDHQKPREEMFELDPRDVAQVDDFGDPCS